MKIDQTRALTKRLRELQDELKAIKSELGDRGVNVSAPLPADLHRRLVAVKEARRTKLSDLLIEAIELLCDQADIKK